MQCPHCYKNDLDDRATRRHHCGGQISHTSFLDVVFGIVVIAVLAVVVSLLVAVLTA